MSRTVFFGFGAYVGALKSLTECSWWDDDPATVYKFAQTALVPVNLAMNLSAARAGKIKYDDVQCDDHRQDGGQTTIGAMFPTGATIGACWLSEQYYQKLPNKPPRQPVSAPNDAYDYELTSYQYYGGELGDRRFFGFHANFGTTKAGLTQVDIWNAGTGRTKQPAAGTWWLDLTQVAAPGYPASGSGPLFLDAATTKTLMLAGPKRPPNMGDVDFP